MNDERPLSTLLSIVLIAFTLEFDNEFERRIPRGTKAVSLVMWSNLMRFVDADGVSIREFGSRTGLTKDGLKTWLTRLSKWWGYVTIAPDPSDRRSKPPLRDWVVFRTPAGDDARRIWQPLFGVIEERWKTRFGDETIARLRVSLRELTSGLAIALPEYPPVVYNDFFTRIAPSSGNTRACELGEDASLCVLLSAALLAYAVEFEDESDLSLAMCANALRVLTITGMQVRDLPGMTGLSKAAIGTSLAFFERTGHATVGPGERGSRATYARLTLKGEDARSAYGRLLCAIDGRWRTRFGEGTIARLRASLCGIIDATGKGGPLLSLGLQPPPGAWRSTAPYATQTAAVLRDPGAALPHYPMVLHRGGWPDGS